MAALGRRCSPDHGVVCAPRHSGDLKTPRRGNIFCACHAPTSQLHATGLRMVARLSVEAGGLATCVFGTGRTHLQRRSAKHWISFPVGEMTHRQHRGDRVCRRATGCGARARSGQYRRTGTADPNETAWQTQARGKSGDERPKGVVRRVDIGMKKGSVRSPSKTTVCGCPQMSFTFNSRGGTRTPDPVINSHLLYQLSYSGRILRGIDMPLVPGGKLVRTPMAGNRHVPHRSPCRLLHWPVNFAPAPKCPLQLSLEAT
jgi:hypothetical protein